MSVLEIKNLHVNVETEQGPREILRGVDLTINEGEIHAIMRTRCCSTSPGPSTRCASSGGG